MPMAFEILFIILLIIANGIFAMSEIAVVSSRKARLQLRAEEGDPGAKTALEMANLPSRFLSNYPGG
jgi:putative hemolysin